MTEPLFIEKSSIIQLSRYDSNDKKDNNSEWTNSISHPISLSPNDSIFVKQVFIDNRQLSSDSIEIPRDMSVNFQYIFYYQNTGIGMFQYDFTNNINSPVITPLYQNGLVDGMPFMLVNQQLQEYPNFIAYGKPVVEQKTITLKKDIYSKSYLAAEITRQFQEVNIQSSGLTMNNIFTTSGNIIPYYSGSQPPNPPFYNFSFPLQPPPSKNISTTMMKQLYYISLADIPGLNIGGSLFYLNSLNQPIFCKLVPMIDPTQANYTNLYNDTYLKLLVPISNIDNSGNPIVGGGLSFKYNGVQYNREVFDCGFCGTSIPALIFNQDGNNKFNFVYHTPIMQNDQIVVGTNIYNPGTPPNSIYINQNKISHLTALSGICLVNIYETPENMSGVPTSPYLANDILLLSLLGFEKSDLIPIESVPLVFSYENNLISPLATNKQYFTNSDYQKYTTRGFSPLSVLSSSLTTTLPQIVKYGASSATYTMELMSSVYISLEQKGYNFVESTNFDYIESSNYAITSQTDGGHFLLDISSYGYDNFISSNKIYDIKAICGNYLAQANFTQTLGPDSYIFIEPLGEPITLTQFTIRILNPLTKEPADWVGPNSSVYLQIVKHEEINEPNKPTKK